MVEPTVLSVWSSQLDLEPIVIKLTDKSCKPIPRIRNLKALSEELPEIASNIFNSLGSQQCEKTYQRCLRMDLEEAGLEIEEEKEIRLEYKGRSVGTRRIDLLVKTESNERAVIELKAVGSINPNHASQLKYYMEHFNIDHGYLINFPHDDGFPPVHSHFELEALKGVVDVEALDARTISLRKDPSYTDVQIVEFRRSISDEQETSDREVATDTVWGVTKSGLPCKICIRDQRFCRFHKDQAECSTQERNELEEAQEEAEMSEVVVQTLDISTRSPQEDPSCTEVQIVELISNKHETIDSEGAANSQWGVTKAGLPCKICIREQHFCRFHKDQTENGSSVPRPLAEGAIASSLTPLL